MLIKLRLILVGAVMFCSLAAGASWFDRFKKEKHPNPAKTEKQQVDPFTHIKNGMSQEKLLEILGPPKGVMKTGDTSAYVFENITIQVCNGSVTNLPDDFLQQIKRRKNTPIKKVAAPKKKFDWKKPKAKKKKVRSVTGKDGRPVDHSLYISRGRVTVIDFYADWCGPCRQIAPGIKKVVGHHNGVVLKKVNIQSWDSNISKKYNVTSIPEIRVFDKDGDLVAAGVRSPQQLEKVIERAKKR